MRSAKIYPPGTPSPASLVYYEPDAFDSGTSKIGHEPIPPYPTKTIFGKPALALPNVLKYVLYIKSVDGFVGIYRGLAPKLCSNVISGFTFHKVSEALRRNTDDKNERYVEDELSEEQRREKFARTLASDVAAQTAAIIASQPFNVIAVRMMAQFVGAEKIYSGVLSSIGHIYHEEGLLGFFSGLMPRLLGELVALVISSTITYFINSYIISDRELHTYTMATSRDNWAPLTGRGQLGARTTGRQDNWALN
ncbi:unnamed protein product [Timema podura]|uniref:Uncharacterized protein n=1 Tax=Timema podura TaxID=61482 RepID=A0ABN7P4N9_TIMPD|nr:unnamed protein product [Timema podura]